MNRIPSDIFRVKNPKMQIQTAESGEYRYIKGAHTNSLYSNANSKGADKAANEILSPDQFFDAHAYSENHESEDEQRFVTMMEIEQMPDLAKTMTTDPKQSKIQRLKDLQLNKKAIKRFNKKGNVLEQIAIEKIEVDGGKGKKAKKLPKQTKAQEERLKKVEEFYGLKENDCNSEGDLSKSKIFKHQNLVEDMILSNAQFEVRKSSFNDEELFGLQRKMKHKGDLDEVDENEF